jgi:hypothetical protein
MLEVYVNPASTKSSKCLPPSSPTLLAPYGSTFLPPKTAPSGLRRFGLAALRACGASGLRRFGLGALLPPAGEGSLSSLHVWLEVIFLLTSRMRALSKVGYIFWLEKRFSGLMSESVF